MIPLSLQLYTIRQTMQQDVAAGLKQVSAAGYTGVEFAGYYDIPAGEMRQLLEQNQLRPVSSHISLEQLQDNLDFHINYLQQLGCDFLVCPWAQMENVQQAGIRRGHSGQHSGKGEGRNRSGADGRRPRDRQQGRADAVRKKKKTIRHVHKKKKGGQGGLS